MILKFAVCDHQLLDILSLTALEKTRKSALFKTQGGGIPSNTVLIERTDMFQFLGKQETAVWFQKQTAKPASRV